MINVALAASACAGWAAMAHWIKRSPAFADPLSWDEVEDWWQQWLEGAPS